MKSIILLFIASLLLANWNEKKENWSQNQFSGSKDWTNKAKTQDWTKKDEQKNWAKKNYNEEKHLKSNEQVKSLIEGTTSNEINYTKKIQECEANAKTEKERDDCWNVNVLNKKQNDTKSRDESKIKQYEQEHIRSQKTFEDVLNKSQQKQERNMEELDKVINRKK